MSSRQSSAAHVIARLVPALDERTCHQLRALLADDLATRDAVVPANHSLIGITAVIAAIGHVPSIAQYENARQEHPTWPHHSSLNRRYGSWLHAVNAAAKLIRSPPSRAYPTRQPSRSYTRADCAQAILQCKLAIGDWPHRSEYQRWRTIEAELARRTGSPHNDLPPDYDVRERLGSWTMAVQFAQHWNQSGGRRGADRRRREFGLGGREAPRAQGTSTAARPGAPRPPCGRLLQ